jgi:hypothetical protein
MHDFQPAAGQPKAELYRELLAAADLKLSQVVPTALEVSVVEAVCA